MLQSWETASTSDYHGKGGPLPVSTTTAGNPNEMSRLFVKAAVANGTRGGWRRSGHGYGHAETVVQHEHPPSRLPRTAGMPDVKDYNGKSQYGAAVAQVRNASRHWGAPL